jgi:RNA polymerase sigma-70 factor, ECF subfamily
MAPPGTDEADREAMKRLAAGGDAALDELMERYGESLFHFLIRSLQNESDAADLAQETFVRIYQNRASFDPRHKFVAWMYAIAGNLVRDRYRWRSRHPQVSLDAEIGVAEVSMKDSLRAAGQAPDERLQSGELGAAVQRAVAALPEELRQPLILAVYEELSQAEIAEILGCSAKAVETRIYRARKQLRASLAGLEQHERKES